MTLLYVISAERENIFLEIKDLKSGYFLLLVNFLVMLLSLFVSK